MDQHWEIGRLGDWVLWVDTGLEEKRRQAAALQTELSTKGIVLDGYLSVNKNATGRVGAVAILSLTCKS